MKLTSKAAINVEKVFPTPKRKGSKRSINEASENSSTPFTRGGGGGGMNYVAAQNKFMLKLI